MNEIPEFKQDRKEMTLEELEKKSEQDMKGLKDEREELDKILKEQSDDEERENKRLYGDIVADEKINRMIDTMEADEASRQQQRILDELSDRKEEDGGDYRAL